MTVTPKELERLRVARRARYAKNLNEVRDKHTAANRKRYREKTGKNYAPTDLRRRLHNLPKFAKEAVVVDQLGIKHKLEVLTLKELASFLKMNVETIRKWKRNGMIPLPCLQTTNGPAGHQYQDVYCVDEAREMLRVYAEHLLIMPYYRTHHGKTRQRIFVASATERQRLGLYWEK
jgi:hypothetical protein